LNRPENRVLVYCFSNSIILLYYMVVFAVISFYVFSARNIVRDLKLAKRLENRKFIEVNYFFSDSLAEETSAGELRKSIVLLKMSINAEIADIAEGRTTAESPST